MIRQRERTMINMWEGMKYACILAVIVFIASLMLGEASSSAPIDKVESAVTAAMDLSGMEKASNRMMKRLYGLNANDYEGAVLYISTFNMDVEELLIVKVKETSQAETVSAAAQSRKETQLTNFDGYGVEQCQLLNDSVLNVKGNYILFVVSPDAKEAEKAFLGSL